MFLFCKRKLIFYCTRYAATFTALSPSRLAECPNSALTCDVNFASRFITLDRFRINNRHCWLLLRAAAATPCVPAEDLVSLRLTVGSGESKQQIQPLHSYAYSEVPQQLALPARPLRACAPAV